jgi:hypothetical protein
MVSASKMCRLCISHLIQWTCAGCFLPIESTTIQTDTLSKNIGHATFLSGKNDPGRSCDFVGDKNDRQHLVDLLGRLEGRYHVQTLAFGIQNEQRHRMFKPGETWWVSSLGDGWRKKCSQAQHICDQLGIAVSDMMLAFGNKATSGRTLVALPSTCSAVESWECEFCDGPLDQRVLRTWKCLFGAALRRKGSQMQFGWEQEISLI